MCVSLLADCFNRFQSNQRSENYILSLLPGQFVTCGMGTLGFNGRLLHLYL